MNGAPSVRLRHPPRHTIPHDAPCRIPKLRSARDLDTLFREIVQRHGSDHYTRDEYKAYLYTLQVARSILRAAREEKRRTKGRT